MILPENEHYDKEIDFLSEECLGLAKDIIDLDEDIEGLTDWTNDFVKHYNSALDDVNTNFTILDNRTQSLRKDVDAGNNRTMWVFGLLIWNAILTGAIIYVLF